MRRDVYIGNDSGGFSVIAASAADAIIADDRSDDAHGQDEDGRGVAVVQAARLADPEERGHLMLATPVSDDE
jgi:hypothetical protein